MLIVERKYIFFIECFIFVYLGVFEYVCISLLRCSTWNIRNKRKNNIMELEEFELKKMEFKNDVGWFIRDVYRSLDDLSTKRFSDITVFYNQLKCDYMVLYDYAFKASNFASNFEFRDLYWSKKILIWNYRLFLDKYEL